MNFFEELKRRNVFKVGIAYLVVSWLLLLRFPRSKTYLQAARLPEYWRKVGWPDMCSPIGEDDFECH